LKKSTAGLVDWNGTLAIRAEAEQVTSTNRASTLILLFAGIGLFVGSGLAILIIRSLIGSILPIVEVLQQISQHNLCIPDVEVTTDDELGQAGNALNTMKANLSKMVNSITQSAEQLAAATAQIATGAKHSSESARGEAEQALQAASAMQEMSATVREVADHAEKASEASARSAHAARKVAKWPTKPWPR